MRVGMRQINLSDTTQADGGKTPNSPLRVYDTSSPYTDPAITVDVTKGLAPVREQWIEDRDTEFSAITSRESNRIAIKEGQLSLQKVRKGKSGKNVSPLWYARQGIVTPKWSTLHREHRPVTGGYVC